MSLWAHIGQRVTEASGRPFRVRDKRIAGGGCINTAYVIGDGERRYFVKLNEPGAAPMFEAEAQGLRELCEGGALRVPGPVCHGATPEAAFLVMEFLPLGGARRDTAQRLGYGLARQHRVTRARFGWRMDNTIGSTPQPNPPTDDWVAFYREHRLLFQLELAARNGHSRLQAPGERLASALEAFFQDYRPAPSLLHGDLWGGNSAALAGGEPVLFDPAVYYGDREADIAMTELFGGFAQDFYSAYRESWPLDAGYGVRRTLYNLYHVLNHLNLFGGGYLAQAERMIHELLAEIG